MYPATLKKRASAPSGALYRPAEPAVLPGVHRRVNYRHLATGLACRLAALLASMDFRQLAGPTAVFFLWPPGPRHSPAATAHDHTAA